MTSSVNNTHGQTVSFDHKRPITPEDFIDYYNSCKDTFGKLTTAQINRTYDIKDSDGNLYKFTRTKDGPKVIRDYAKHITKMELSERITIVETRLKEIDFLAQRIRDLEEMILTRYSQNVTSSKDVSGKKTIRERSSTSSCDSGTTATAKAGQHVQKSICD